MLKSVCTVSRPPLFLTQLGGDAAWTAEQSCPEGCSSQAASAPAINWAGGRRRWWVVFQGGNFSGVVWALVCWWEMVSERLPLCSLVFLPFVFKLHLNPRVFLGLVSLFSSIPWRRWGTKGVSGLECWLGSNHNTCCPEESAA